MVQAEPQVRSQDLVGRERECAEIDRMLDGARRGESRVLVLRGEAGMGKTVLLAYAATAGRAAQMTVLSVTGVEWESDLSFAGLHGLLWPIVDELKDVPEPQRGPLAAALGLAPGEGHDRFLVRTPYGGTWHRPRRSKHRTMLWQVDRFADERGERHV
jgi:hypothetical protein